MQTRKQRGYTLEYMGTELGISDSAYRKIENNQVRLSLENFIQIAKVLDVPINELLELKTQQEYHQHNNDKGTFIGHQEFENYYQENKEITNRLIISLESSIEYLREENLFLRNQLSEKK